MDRTNYGASSTVSDGQHFHSYLDATEHVENQQLLPGQVFMVGNSQVESQISDTGLKFGNRPSNCGGNPQTLPSASSDDLPGCSLY
jgi:hypothetical protein